MSIVEIKVPSPGESITEVEIATWLKTNGDYVELDEDICEVDSDKATLGLPSEAAGTIEILVEEGETVQVGEVVAKIDIVALMAQGDAMDGKKIFKKCAACHSIVKNGGNKIGPALYNVVGRKVGNVADYKYSKALAAYGKEWSFEELNGFLKKPSTYLKGTKMSYAGLRKEKDRASIIIYLNNNSDSPKQLP